jgi:hypothetical protein
VTISRVHQAGSKRVFVAIIEMIAGAQNYVFEQLVFGNPTIQT